MVSREKIPNTSKPKPITEKQAIGVANRQIFQKDFKPDYDQVVKRISTAPFQGLRCGQPPGRVV